MLHFFRSHISNKEKIVKQKILNKEKNEQMKKINIFEGEPYFFEQPKPQLTLDEQVLERGTEEQGNVLEQNEEQRQHP